MEEIRKVLRSQIKSIDGIVEEGKNRFSKGKNRIWIKATKNEVTVEPVGYYYTSKEEAHQWEFELKGVIQNYVQREYWYPRLSFEDRKEDGKQLLYCTIEAAGVKTEFRPEWFELLNGINQMVFVEYKNAINREKDHMLMILKSLRKITRRAEDHCKKLGYNV